MSVEEELEGHVWSPVLPHRNRPYRRAGLAECFQIYKQSYSKGCNLIGHRGPGSDVLARKILMGVPSSLFCGLSESGITSIV